MSSHERWQGYVILQEEGYISTGFVPVVHRRAASRFTARDSLALDKKNTIPTAFSPRINDCFA